MVQPLEPRVGVTFDEHQPRTRRLEHCRQPILPRNRFELLPNISGNLFGKHLATERCAIESGVAQVCRQRNQEPIELSARALKHLVGNARERCRHAGHLSVRGAVPIIGSIGDDPFLPLNVGSIVQYVHHVGHMLRFAQSSLPGSGEQHHGIAVAPGGGIGVQLGRPGLCPVVSIAREQGYARFIVHLGQHAHEGSVIGRSAQT